MSISIPIVYLVSSCIVLCSKNCWGVLKQSQLLLPGLKSDYGPLLTGRHFVDYYWRLLQQTTLKKCRLNPFLFILHKTRQQGKSRYFLECSLFDILKYSRQADCTEGLREYCDVIEISVEYFDILNREHSWKIKIAKSCQLVLKSRL